MYIPYDFLIKYAKNNHLKDFFNNKKINQNCNFIARNKKKVLKKLRNKQELRVIFYVYDSCKWKCQSIYDEMLKIPRFFPIVIVTKNSATNFDNPSYQSREEIIKTYNFFKKRGMNVELGYDFDNDKHIPFEKFQPDIVIYQHPWYVETSQGPVICSKFALTAYVPYDISVTTLDIEYNLRFFQYVQNYYVINDILKDFYTPLMINKGINLKAVGSPSLDYLYKNKDNKTNKYVIYAPHWSINHENTIAYSTFKEVGDFMLNFAIKHPEFNWVFKPHPMLKKAIVDNKLMSETEVNHYYNKWNEVGLTCYDGNYFDLFINSKLLITDCCTFLMEYFATAKPLIRLDSGCGAEFNSNTKEIIKYFYNVSNLSELEHYLNELLINDNDKLKKLREEKSIQFKKNATNNIIDDLLAQLS